MENLNGETRTDSLLRSRSGSKHYQRGVTFFVTLLFVLFPCASTAEIYLTQDQALDIILESDTEHIYDPKPVSAEVAQMLRERKLETSQPQKTAHFFVGKRNGLVTGYALIDNEIGKHLPITYIVGISPAGKVTRVEMMVFREIRGWEPRERRFMKQFEEKSKDDTLKVGDSIRNVTGATLSARAITKGVSRALLLWQNYYGTTRYQSHERDIRPRV